MNIRSMSGEEVRENILNATEQLLGRYGYRKMTMEDVAREAGIGKGTTYLYFPSKEELVLSTVDRLVDGLLEELGRVASAHNQTAGAALRLEQMLVARVMIRFDKVQGYSSGLNDFLAAVRPSLLKRRELYFTREAEIFARVLGEGLAAGEFSFQESAGDVAGTLLLATNSLLPFSLSPQELGERSEIETKARRIARLVIFGLSPGGAPRIQTHETFNLRQVKPDFE